MKPPHRPVDLSDAARRVLGIQELREGQAEAMAASMAGRDVLAVMPTGYGKSALYQVPAALLTGVTVVVSPLIALQRDQVAALGEAPGAPPARALNSTQGTAEVDNLWAQLESAERHILFLAPEQLARDEVVERLSAMEVPLLVLDEAHCISAWGHDFRPDYRRVGTAVERLGHPRLLALTATASPPVRDDIVERLGMRDPVVLVRGFDRPNLWLEVRRHVDDHAKRADVVDTVAELRGRGLLYVGTRRDTTEYAGQLTDRGLTVAAYHGGMRADERRMAHERFAQGAVDVVVATSAFGMGIDQPDIRFVAHAVVPDSPDTYYQEIGRAGRDGEPARAVLFYRPEDFGLHRFHAGGSPDETLLREIITGLRRRRRGVPLADLRAKANASPRRVTGAVNLLEAAGALRIDGRVVHQNGVGVREAVSRAAAEAQARTRVDQSRMDMMRGYAETTGCRREFLLGYLGERLRAPCGNCDTCKAGATGQPNLRGDDPFPASSRVLHAQWGEGIVMSTESDRLTVLFPREGYRTLSLQAVEQEGLLHPG